VNQPKGITFYSNGNPPLSPELAQRIYFDIHRCPVCAREITYADFDAGRVLAMTGQGVTAVCTEHLFTADGQQTPDYDRHLKTVALAYAKAEELL
jgi:hypothetical protein